MTKKQSGTTFVIIGVLIVAIYVVSAYLNARDLEDMQIEYSKMKNENNRNLFLYSKKRINEENFIENLFNAEYYIITTINQIDIENNKLIDNPSLFSVFGEKNEAYLAIFSDTSKVDVVTRKYPSFDINVPVIAGDLLMGINQDCGFVINPYSDGYYMWSDVQLADIKRHMKKVNNRWVFK